MAHRTDTESLRMAWRALAGTGAGDGWRTIPIEVEAEFRLFAGRHWPGDEEAIIVGFRNVRLPPESHLPQGHGFKVGGISGSGLDDTLTWIALSKKVGGSLDLFVMMASDVVELLENLGEAASDRAFQIFLTRIRAWQDFMERGRDGLLSPEAEVGLVGELLLLRNLIEIGVPATLALESWQGPLDGLQDFMIGSGAIEVKATLSANGFPATVNSLEQLDETLRYPLYVAGVRLLLGSGPTLPEHIKAIEELLRGEHEATATFLSRLVQAGYLTAMAQRYVRRFSHAGTKIVPVEGPFPRLTRGSVAGGIRKARYEIDLDLAGTDDVELKFAIEKLEGI